MLSMCTEDITPRCTFSEILEDLGMLSRLFCLGFGSFPSSCSWNYLLASSSSLVCTAVASGSPAAGKNTVAWPGPLGHCSGLGLTPPLPEHVSAAVVRQRWEENPSINSAAAEA